MEDHNYSNGITLEDIKHLGDEPKTSEAPRKHNYDAYADNLRYQIAVRKAALRSIRANRSTLVGKWIRLIRWASQPKNKKSYRLPGIGLEASLIGLHLLIGVGHLAMYFQG